jgi:hypothetical protein
LARQGNQVSKSDEGLTKGTPSRSARIGLDEKGELVPVALFPTAHVTFFV